MSVFSFFVKADSVPAAVPNQTVVKAGKIAPTDAESAVEWYSDEYEGQLSVDVFQTPDYVVVRSTIAGVRPEDLDITLNNDVITIRGRRYQEAEVAPEDYFYQECYWGGFSRSIVLPVEVDPEKVEASLKNGVLTIKLPKIKTKSVSVKVEVEE
ncbi:MAG: Hsp20/alpha crystallin family protein [Patescibacteria group bacterium]